MYVSSDVMNALEQAPELTHTVELTRVADGGVGVETRVTELDGVPVMEVVDDEVFYDKFNFAGDDGGFAPAAGAHKINVLVASPLTTKLVPKISSIYFFAPGGHPQGDGYLYQNRALRRCVHLPQRQGRPDRQRLRGRGYRGRELKGGVTWRWNAMRTPPTTRRCTAMT